MERKKIAGSVFIGLAAILWGLDGVVLTPRLHNLKIGYVVFMIHAIPFLIMNLFLFKEYRNLKKFEINDVINLTIIALLGGAIGTLAIVKALFLVHFQELSVVVLLQKLQPIFGISVAALLLKERLNKQFILWSALAIISGYFLTFGFRFPNFQTGENLVMASFLSLLAAFSFGSVTAFGKKALAKFSFKTVTFFRYGFTSLMMLIYVIVTKQFSQISVTTQTNWIIFVIIGLTTGSGAIFLFYYGLTKVKAMISTICELLFPLSAILFDYLINNNSLELVQWIAVGVLLISILRITLGNNLKKSYKER